MKNVSSTLPFSPIKQTKRCDPVACFRSRYERSPALKDLIEDVPVRRVIMGEALSCTPANETSKERRGFGLEEVHPGEPCGRPNSPQSPKNKQTASACLIGHIWGFVAAATAVDALPCFSSAAAYRSPGGSDGIGLQCVGSNSTSTLAVDIQRPFCHCPACPA